MFKFTLKVSKMLKQNFGELFDLSSTYQYARDH